MTIDGSLIVRNKAKFVNLEENNNWNFHILDGYNKDVVIDN